VKVRNPWSSESYNGPWNDKDDKWSEAFKREAGFVSANDGTFYTPIENYKDGFMFSINNGDNTN